MCQKQKYAPSVFEKYVTTISLGGKEIKLVLYDTAGKTLYQKSPIFFINSTIHFPLSGKPLGLFFIKNLLRYTKFRYRATVCSVFIWLLRHWQTAEVIKVDDDVRASSTSCLDLFECY